MGLPLVPASNPITAIPDGATGEGANQILEGVFAAVGPSRPINVYGAFNVSLFGVITGTLTTFNGSSIVTFDPDTALEVGQGIVSDLLPPGVTVGGYFTTGVGTVATVQLAGLTTTQIGTIVAGTDAAAYISGIGVTPEATVNLERTFDGGYTWITAGVGGLGQPASYAMGASGIDNPVSFVAAEPERQMGYRYNCVAFSGSTAVKYRLSISGLAAMSWGIPIG